MIIPSTEYTLSEGTKKKLNLFGGGKVSSAGKSNKVSA
jgi:hypothetical protein